MFAAPHAPTTTVVPETATEIPKPAPDGASAGTNVRCSDHFVPDCTNTYAAPEGCLIHAPTTAMGPETATEVPKLSFAARLAGCNSTGCVEADARLPAPLAGPSSRRTARRSAAGASASVVGACRRTRPRCGRTRFATGPA